ncbi:MAG: hypothetical protein AAFU79_17940 [Myxococcota bacterium]
MQGGTLLTHRRRLSARARDAILPSVLGGPTKTVAGVTQYQAMVRDVLDEQGPEERHLR